MFKSVFIKYISAFMLINILSIVLSTTIITTLVNSYDENTRMRTVSNVAYSITNYVIDDYNESGQASFGAYLDESLSDILPVLNMMSINVDSIVVLISDGDGHIRLAAGSELSKQYLTEDGSVTDGLTYPPSVMENLAENGAVTRNDDLDGFFTDNHIVSILPITSLDGKVVGSVLAATIHSAMDALLDAMIKTIIMSSLWLMLAALIAVYLISERLVSPIRAMNKAAKEFAAGHFDVRVPVNGNDEIAELAETFNNMAASLEHNEEMRRLFLANVSHDLRTPMTEHSRRRLRTTIWRSSRARFADFPVLSTACSTSHGSRRGNGNSIWRRLTSVSWRGRSSSPPNSVWKQRSWMWYSTRTATICL